ncbi:membrane protein [Arthrobacter phage Tokki]|nr:membrane protein [Arthrobacter phage Tokki]
MSQPTMNDILNMTPEQQKELERKVAKRFMTFVALKAGIAIGTVVAVKALARHIEKAEQQAHKVTR